MFDDDLQRHLDPNRRRRTSTRLSAMGLLALQARASRDVDDEDNHRQPHKKVVLGTQAFHRSDITEGAAGIPLLLFLTVVDEMSGFGPVAGASVEIWHCDADGVFSDYARKMYPESAATTYLRGVQTTNAVGQVMFRTIYPGWSGARAPHIQVRVYHGATPKKALQIGFPNRISVAVYQDALHYVKGPTPTRNDADEVFGDASASGVRDEFQIAAVSGSNVRGYVATVSFAVRNFAFA